MLGPRLNEHGQIKPLNKVLDNDRIKQAWSNQILGRAFDRIKIKRARSNQTLERVFDKSRINCF